MTSLRCYTVVDLLPLDDFSSDFSLRHAECDYHRLADVLDRCMKSMVDQNKGRSRPSQLYSCLYSDVWPHALSAAVQCAVWLGLFSFISVPAKSKLCHFEKGTTNEQSLMQRQPPPTIWNPYNSYNLASVQFRTLFFWHSVSKDRELSFWQRRLHRFLPRLSGSGVGHLLDGTHRQLWIYTHQYISSSCAHR